MCTQWIALTGKGIKNTVQRKDIVTDGTPFLVTWNHSTVYSPGGCALVTSLPIMSLSFTLKDLKSRNCRSVNPINFSSLNIQFFDFGVSFFKLKLKLSEPYKFQFEEVDSVLLLGHFVYRLHLQSFL